MTPGTGGDWNEQIELPGKVRFMEGVGELSMVSVSTEWSSAEIYLQGAHVTHFQKVGEPPLLFLSQLSHFHEGRAIRGGIPVILPWFGPRPGQPAHGFARTRPWALHQLETAKDGGLALRFRLVAGAEHPDFPPFTAEYTVGVREALSLQLAVTNNSSGQNLVFEECLHTYLAVGDISTVAVTGLRGVTYLDKVAGFAETIESGESIRFGSETDRVYLNAPGPVEVLDPNLRRRILVEKANSNSTVVWNPWIDKARQLEDFGNEEYQRMLCVESGNVAANRVTLPPGETFTMGVRLSAAAL